MEEVRCSCRKIVAQKDGDTVIIKCRHCKRVILIRTKGITSVESLDWPQGLLPPPRELQTVGR